MDDIRRVLVLGPHTDDGEFGCGGTMARLVSKDVEVHYAMFSLCEASVPQGYPNDVLRTEALEASSRLGIAANLLTFFDFPVRRFPEHRQEILEAMVEMREELDPELVLAPSRHDTHQDHEIICREAWRAFKYTRILGYEVPWNARKFEGDFFVSLTGDEVDQKVHALGAYDSQGFRHYANGDFIRSLARVRGAQIQTQFAEAFDTYRWIA